MVAVSTVSPAETMKKCKKCGESKPLDAFHAAPDCRDGRRGSCRACVALRDRARYSRPRAMERKRRHLYGIEPEDYDRMNVEQNGRCAICRLPRPLVVDHDHATGLVRGLLCRSCNAALGMLSDDVENLSAAIDYLGAR